MINQTSISCLIIDDDSFILRLLQDKITQFIPRLKVLDTAQSGTDGLQKIRSLQPDLVFLDVEMEDMTGFEMLARVPQINFRTIFITSYRHYAIKAIRFNALDYLIKPIDLGELKAAVKRFKANDSTEVSYRMNQALNNLKTPNSEDKKLVVKSDNGELALPLKSIVRIQAERNYSYIHLLNGKKILSSKNLGEFELILEEMGFYRPHKSHLINFMHVQVFKKNLFFLLNDTSEIPLARRKKGDAKFKYERYLAGSVS